MENTKGAWFLPVLESNENHWECKYSKCIKYRKRAAFDLFCQEEQLKTGNHAPIWQIHDASSEYFIKFEEDLEKRWMDPAIKLSYEKKLYENRTWCFTTQVCLFYCLHI